MRSKMILLVPLMSFIASCSNASDLDIALNKAKAESRIVMLELGSVGCIPCERMKPVMQKLGDSYREQLDVIFIDVRKDREIAGRFNVHIIPVQVFLDKSGKEFHRHIGFYSYEEIAAMLKKTGILQGKGN